MNNPSWNHRLIAAVSAAVTALSILAGVVALGDSERGVQARAELTAAPEGSAC
jgi:hypothetical protein